jgi:hypothetical protein
LPRTAPAAAVRVSEAREDGVKSTQRHSKERRNSRKGMPTTLWDGSLGRPVAEKPRIGLHTQQSGVVDFVIWMRGFLQRLAVARCWGLHIRCPPLPVQKTPGSGTQRVAPLLPAVTHLADLEDNNLAGWCISVSRLQEKLQIDIGRWDCQESHSFVA